MKDFTTEMLRSFINLRYIHLGPKNYRKSRNASKTLILTVFQTHSALDEYFFQGNLILIPDLLRLLKSERKIAPTKRIS